MARNKAIFDADILINMIKTNSLDYFTNAFEQIYISDYVWEHEINEGTDEYKVIKKMVNRGFVIILEYEKLTPKQQGFYRNTYNILKEKASLDSVNEGERRTAAFAKAHSVAYYMSDDNKAAPFIKSLSAVEVINYCDLLYIAYSSNPNDIKQLANFYSAYLYVLKDSIPKILKDKIGNTLDFVGIIGKAYDKFNKSPNLTDLMKLFANVHNRLEQK